MTRSVERPVLFLDVDGPLIPFGPSSRRLQTPAAGSAAFSDEGNPLLGRLDQAVGPRLMALGCELVWASTWMDDANESVAPRIGLPRLPVVEWPQASTDEGPRGLHGKTRHLVEWAGQRPFIWVDDEISAMDRLWVAAQHQGLSLLHRVDPAEGLTDGDFSVLADWLRTAVPGLAVPAPVEGGSGRLGRRSGGR
ncbi:HAD domain-containing protein [Streptomyces avermitilis]|uniref:HAD domain-containing protein n=1 Tax=Streptomyces avermitilis TaxID=33903 RepID=UPI0033CC7F74